MSLDKESGVLVELREKWQKSPGVQISNLINPGGSATKINI